MPGSPWRQFLLHGRTDSRRPSHARAKPASLPAPRFRPSADRPRLPVPDSAVPMPRSKYTPITSDNPVIAGPRASADRLYRAAAECVRQRQRYGALVEAGAAEEEQRAALRVASLCDDLLQEAIDEYEKAPVSGSSK